MGKGVPTKSWKDRVSWESRGGCSDEQKMEAFPAGVGGGVGVGVGVGEGVSSKVVEGRGFQHGRVFRRAKKRSFSNAGVLRTGADDNGRKKIILIKPIGSSNLPVGSPVQTVQPQFNAIPVQLTGPDRNRNQPTVEPVGLAGPIRFLKSWE